MCQGSDDGFGVDDAALDPGDITLIGEQDDAFDDAWLLADGAGGTGASYFLAPSGQVDLDGNTVATDFASFGGLQVAVTHTVFADAARLRTIYTFVNPGAEAVTRTFQTETDLGSDQYTAIAGTSSGDSAWTAADRWLVTWEDVDGSCCHHGGQRFRCGAVPGPGVVRLRRHGTHACRLE